MMAAKDVSHPCIRMLHFLSKSELFPLPLDLAVPYDLFWPIQYIGSNSLPIPGLDLRGLPAYAVSISYNSCHVNESTHLAGERCGEKNTLENESLPRERERGSANFWALQLSSLRHQIFE